MLSVQFWVPLELHLGSPKIQGFLHAKPALWCTANSTRNADLIAAGLAPFNPESAAFKAGRLMLEEIDECVDAGHSFAFETTLSGLTYLKKIALWQAHGYQVKLWFLSLPNEDIAVSRVARRVLQGGHNIPEDVIRRRFKAGLENFHER